MNQTKLPLDKLNNVLIFLKKKGLTQEDAEDILQESCISFLKKEKLIEILDPFSYFFTIAKMNLLNYFSVRKRRKLGEILTIEKLRLDQTPLSYNNGEFSYDYKQYLEMQKHAEGKNLEKYNSNVPQAQMLCAVYQMKYSEKSKFKGQKVIRREKYD